MYKCVYNNKYKKEQSDSHRFHVHKQNYDLHPSNQPSIHSSIYPFIHLLLCLLTGAQGGGGGVLELGGLEPIPG